MAYSGVYTVRNRKKYKGDPDKVVYRSLWEKHAFNWCDKNKDIVGWSSEEVVIPYRWDVDKKGHRYFPDLKITFKNGKTILVEIKPAKETEKPNFPGKKTKRYLNESMTYVKNINKWEAAKSYCKDRKWEFEIWTEHTLDQMGIMPKAQKFKSLGQPFKKQKAPPRGKGLKVGSKPYKKFTK